jgi:nucleoside-diphosphate-sugar epimerase
MYGIAYTAQFVGKLLGTQFRISPFNVSMLSIDRYFDISDAKRDLKYKPLKTFEQGWEETMQWFQDKQEFIKVCHDNTIPKKQ